MDQRKKVGELISMNSERPGVIHVYEEDKITIGRDEENTNPIFDNRIAYFHCSIFFQDGQVVLKNLTTQGTYLNKEKMGLDLECNLEHGDHIHLLCQKGKKVTEKHVIAYMFFKYENKKRSARKSSKSRQPLLELISDDLICIICSEMYYEGVSVSPCGHVFCGYCLEVWEQKHNTCPICRLKMRNITKAFQINKIITTFLEVNPDVEQNPKPKNKYFIQAAENDESESNSDSSASDDSDSEYENDIIRRIQGDQNLRRQLNNINIADLLALNNQQRQNNQQGVEINQQPPQPQAAQIQQPLPVNQRIDQPQNNQLNEQAQQNPQQNAQQNGQQNVQVQNAPQNAQQNRQAQNGQPQNAQPQIGQAINAQAINAQAQNAVIHNAQAPNPQAQNAQAQNAQAQNAQAQNAQAQNRQGQVNQQRVNNQQRPQQRPPIQANQQRVQQPPANSQVNQRRPNVPLAGQANQQRANPHPINQAGQQNQQRVNRPHPNVVAQQNVQIAQIPPVPPQNQVRQQPPQQIAQGQPRQNQVEDNNRQDIQAQPQQMQDNIQVQLQQAQPLNQIPQIIQPQQPQQVNVNQPLQAALNKECRSCLVEYKGFKCQPNTYHRTCYCETLIPRRDLNTHQNADLKLFCQVCKVYFCKFYYGQQCEKSQQCDINDLQSYRVGFDFGYNYFNRVERARILNHLQGKDRTTIFDFIMQQYISKEQFYFQRNKALQDNVWLELNELLLLNSPVCTYCRLQVQNQIVFRYVQTFKYEEVQFMMPDCWYGINCKIQHNDNQHAQRFNHICEQTKFD